MLKKPVFNSFTEYWYYVRYLSEEQKKIIFKNLSNQQKKFLNDSYIRERWSDLFYRNEINEKLDELKKDYGYDVLDMRLKAIKGKSVYIPIKFWIILNEQMKQYKPEVINFVMEGLEAIPEEKNEQMCLLVYGLDRKEEQDKNKGYEA